MKGLITRKLGSVGFYRGSISPQSRMIHWEISLTCDLGCPLIWIQIRFRIKRFTWESKAPENWHDASRRTIRDQLPDTVMSLFGYVPVLPAPARFFTRCLRCSFCKLVGGSGLYLPALCTPATTTPHRPAQPWDYAWLICPMLVCRYASPPTAQTLIQAGKIKKPHYWVRNVKKYKNITVTA